MILQKDKDILNSLAMKVREIAELPEMQDRKRSWYDFNALKPSRPKVLCFPEGAWCELVPHTSLLCQDEKLRDWELQLRNKIYWWEHIHDDNVLEPWFDISWDVSIGNFGVEVEYQHGDNRGSYTWASPITNLERDMEKLRFRKLAVNRGATQQNLELAHEIFGDVLPARIRGNYWWTLGLTNQLISLIGLENLMLYMYDEPENLHKLVAWMRDEHLHFIDWFEKQKLLTLNNDNDNVGSGGVGYTHELPKNNLRDGNTVSLKDLWGFAESQETVGVSPSMFAEFILPYQLPLLEKFGLNCYGCCEPIHERLDYVLKVPNLRRISISPWCNQEVVAERLGRNYIFSRKPNPSLVCVNFDEAEIRKDISNTLKLTKDCAVEIILKDTHTIQNEPWRISRWVEIANEEIEKL